jgi:hypothetical protein
MWPVNYSSFLCVLGMYLGMGLLYDSIGRITMTMDAPLSPPSPLSPSASFTVSLLAPLGLPPPPVNALLCLLHLLQVGVAAVGMALATCWACQERRARTRMAIGETQGTLQSDREKQEEACRTAAMEEWRTRPAEAEPQASAQVRSSTSRATSPTCVVSPSDPASAHATAPVTCSSPSLEDPEAEEEMHEHEKRSLLAEEAHIDIHGATQGHTLGHERGIRRGKGLSACPTV